MVKIKFFIYLFFIILSNFLFLFNFKSSKSYATDSKKYFAKNVNITSEEEVILLEEEIIGEINRIRISPAAYADELEALIKYYDGNLLKLPGEIPIKTEQGMEGLRDTITILRTLDPLSSLESNEGLTKVAQDLQTIDSGFSEGFDREELAKIYNNYGGGFSVVSQNISHGVSPQGIVIQLILNNTVNQPINLINFLDPILGVIGVSCQKDSDVQNSCTMAYADRYNTIGKKIPETIYLPEAITRKTPEIRKEGFLESGDLVVISDESFYDYYPVEGKANQSFTITLESQDFDPYLAIVDSNLEVIQEHDDISQTNKNSEIDFVLPADGVYLIIVNSHKPQETGKYILSIKRKE